MPNPKKYTTESYKNDVSKSIDWSAYKNPLIPQPKKEKPQFIKIDYLRYSNKSEMFKQNQYTSLSSLDEIKENNGADSSKFVTKSIPLYKVPHKSRQPVLPKSNKSLPTVTPDKEGTKDS